VKALRISDRVRLRGSAALGTVFAVPYQFRGVLRVGVAWDVAPKWFASVAASSLVRVTREPVGVPLEARPLSVGALQAPERRWRPFGQRGTR
jgi:hypothetical protein